MINFATPYNGKHNVVRKDFPNPSLTDESFRDECDIGFILENCIKTGISPNQVQGSFVDCVSVQSYQDAMQLVAQCKSDFECLPSKDRDRFKSVEAYLEFISKKENLKESYEKGYINRDSVDLADIYPDKYKTTFNKVSEVGLDEPVNSSGKPTSATTPQSSEVNPESSA